MLALDNSLLPAGLPNVRPSSVGWGVNPDAIEWGQLVDSIYDLRTTTFRSVSVRLFGAVGDGIHDDTKAFEDALAACPRGYSVYVPPGLYLIRQTLTVPSGVSLVGSRRQWYGVSDTVLRWPEGMYGLILGPADSTYVANLCLWAEGKTTDACGVRPLSRCILDGLYISGWALDGLHFAGTTEPGWPMANLNSSEVTSCAIDGSGRHGVYVTGSDCNAFYMRAVSSRVNGQFGFHDTSLTSGSYVQCHVEENSVGGYYSSNSGAGGVYAYCYAEGGQPNNISHPAVIIGGTGMDGQNVGNAGISASMASATRGLILGGGIAGSLVHTGSLGGDGSTTWNINLTHAWLFPFIGADSTFSAVPAISGGTPGQQLTIFNNTLYRFTIPTHAVAGNGLHLKAPLVLLGGESVTLWCGSSAQFYEFSRSTAAMFGY